MTMRTRKRKRKIVKENGKWCVKSKKGKSLGCYDTEAEAKERLGQVEYFKKNSDELDSRMAAMIKNVEESQRLILEAKELFARLRPD